MKEDSLFCSEMIWSRSNNSNSFDRSILTNATGTMSQLNEKHEAVELDAMKPDEGGMADGRHNIPDIVVLRPVEDIEEDTDVDKGGADHAVHSGPKHDGNKTGIATRARQKPSIITRLVTANFNAKTKIAVVALLFFGIFLLMAAFAVGLGACKFYAHHPTSTWPTAYDLASSCRCCSA